MDLQELAKNTNLEWVCTVKTGSDIPPCKKGEGIEFEIHKWDIGSDGLLPVRRGDVVLIGRNRQNSKEYTAIGIDGFTLKLKPVSKNSRIENTIESGAVFEIKSK